MGQVACQLTLDRSQVNQLGKKKKKATGKNSIKPANAKYLTQHSTTQHNRYALRHTVYSIVLYLSGLLWRIAVDDWF